MPGPVDLWQIVRWLDERLPENAIIANGAGNYATWVHRIFRYRAYRTQLAPYSGSMGYGVPAAVAAKLVHRDRVVLSWNGDGCFLMNGQELATFATLDAAEAEANNIANLVVPGANLRFELDFMSTLTDLEMRAATLHSRA